MNSLLQPQALWNEVLKDLALQMSRATFANLLQQTRLVAVEEGGLYLVETQSEPAQEWLDKRLRPLIERTLAQRAGEGIRLKFIVDRADLEGEMPHPTLQSASDNGAAQIVEEKATVPAPLEISSGLETPGPLQAGPTTLDFSQKVDFELLWQKSGFTMTADYAHHYWRAYLGRSFEPWLLLVSQDKRDVRQMRQGTLPYWTFPKLYSYRRLARILGCSRNSLTGRLQACWLYEAQKTAAQAKGEASPALSCCGRFKGCRPYPHPNGEPRCAYWQEGALERLYREGLLAVERVSRPGSPRAHELRLQIWRLLPLLTPQQVACLKSETERESHRHWLERYSHLAGFDLQLWEQIEVPSLVPYLPGYPWGRHLFQVYRNNPFREMPAGLEAVETLEIREGSNRHEA